MAKRAVEASSRPKEGWQLSYLAFVEGSDPLDDAIRKAALQLRVRVLLHLQESPVEVHEVFVINLRQGNASEAAAFYVLTGPLEFHHRNGDRGQTEVAKTRSIVPHQLEGLRGGSPSSATSQTACGSSPATPGSTPCRGSSPKAAAATSREEEPNPSADLEEHPRLPRAAARVGLWVSSLTSTFFRKDFSSVGALWKYLSSHGVIKHENS